MKQADHSVRAKSSSTKFNPAAMSYTKKPKSSSYRALYQRNSRENKLNQRRFNNPLKEFIAHKYPAIFHEYSELYNKLMALHPLRKDLTRTTTFRQWIAETQPQTPPNPPLSDVLTQALRETIDNNGQEQQERQQQEQDAPPPLEQGPSQLFAEVDELLNELAANRDIGDIVEPEAAHEDEGIELNIYDEIYNDIQPLDYALEVEPGEF